MFYGLASLAYAEMQGRKLVAINLRRIRVQRALTQEALAVDAGLERSYIGRIERSIENPTVDTLDRLATALGIDTCELLRIPGPGEERPPTMRRGRKSTRERLA